MLIVGMNKNDNVKCGITTKQNMLISIYDCREPEARGYRDGGRAVCQHYSHTHYECGQLERQTIDAGERVVDEQVEQALCVRVGRKLCPLHDNIITWQKEPFTASCP